VKIKWTFFGKNFINKKQQNSRYDAKKNKHTPQTICQNIFFLNTHFRSKIYTHPQKRPKQYSCH